MIFACTTVDSGEVGTLYSGGSGDFVTVRTGNRVTIKKAGTATLTTCTRHEQ